MTTPWIVALATILGILVSLFIGYAIRQWWEARREEDARAAEAWTNLDDALLIVEQIDRVRSVQRELKASFARSELDGGAKAALSHPLYLDAEHELDSLHERLMLLI